MELKPFYTSTFFRSLANALISPFIPVFALFLGATQTLIGLTSSLPALANLLFQLFWSSFSESTGKKKTLIIFGGIAWALMWIPIALVKDPVQFVLLLTVQSILAAASIPVRTALLIQIIPSYKMAHVNTNLNLVDGIASFFGTLLGGFILNQFGFVYFLFYIIAFLGIMSRVVLFWTKEPKPYYHPDGNLLNGLKKTFDFSRLKHEKNLTKLIIAVTFMDFSVFLVSPFFSVYIITGLRGNLINIAIISAIGVISTIMFSRPWEKIIDDHGKKFPMLACIIPISFIPFNYAIAPNIMWLYVYEIIGTMSWTGFNLAAFAYLVDTLPKGESSSYIAMYNLFTGLGSVVGPLVGGMLADMISLQQLFIISTMLRLLTIFFLDKLEEKTGVRPRSIFSFGFERFGLMYNIENFVNTYMLVFDHTIKQSISLLKRKKYFKRKGIFRFE